MKKETIDVFKEIFETNKEFQNTIIETHINKLREFDEFFPLNESFSIMTNTTLQSYPFVSKNFEYALGLEIQKMETLGLPYWFSNIHPVDLSIWMTILEEMMTFTMTHVAPEDRKKLNYTWNYRVKNNKGEYLNILEHQTPTYFDEFGKPIIAISHATITGRNEIKPIIGSVKILNEHKEYETLFYKNYSQKLLLPESISTREQDVIRLLALNHTSKEIGEKLFISSHTVDTHRRNLLKKLNFDSTKELIQYCLVNQLF
ncbi:LuxR C-terminal-related transcriptional regulator [Wenyingzhuangia sp. IMCC45574]